MKEKIKILTKNQLYLYFDRLTRFKYPETKYRRVFFDIILKNLSTPSLSKEKLNNLSISDLSEFAKKIWNLSIKQQFNTDFTDYSINKKIFEIESKHYFLNEASIEFLNSELNFAPLLKEADEIYENLPINIKFYTNLYKNKKNFSYIKKILIVEGITEEILLPKLFSLYSNDFLNLGIYIISSGGKNKIAHLYSSLKEIVKMPIYILLDKDGIDVSENILSRLRNTDKIHFIKKGEFEDILPKKTITKTINHTYKNTIEKINTNVLKNNPSTVKALEDFFRINCLGEFKKAEFANNVRLHLNNFSDLSNEIKEILEEILNL